mmetsp:Transcript_21593/g.56075  ORF Transcript_21593/g.56075 Transcript_21593/m.56075 type:complete len:287 (-) Transcript_21593:42-902(-)
MFFYPIFLYVFVQPFKRARVQIICIHLHLPLSSWDCEGSNTAKHVTHNVILAKASDHSQMLLFQPSVPVYLTIVELEHTPILPHLGDVVWLSSQELHWEDAEFVLNSAGLVHYCSNARRELVYNHLANQFFVWEVLVAQVEMGDVTNSLKTCRHFHTFGKQLLEHLFYIVVVVANANFVLEHSRLCLLIQLLRGSFQLVGKGFVICAQEYQLFTIRFRAHYALHPLFVEKKRLESLGKARTVLALHLQCKYFQRRFEHLLVDDSSHLQRQSKEGQKKRQKFQSATR